MYRIHLERDELEDRLGGGIPDCALVVVEGEDGTGKSILSERLLYGALEAGHTASYVSTELTTSQFYQQMASLGYPSVRHGIGGRLRVFEVDAAKREPLLPKLLTAPAVFQRDLVFIDTFSAFVQDASEKGVPSDAIARALGSSISRLKAINGTGTTVVLTVDPTQVPAPQLHRLRSVADVLFEARTEIMGLTAARSIVIRRFNRCGKTIGDVFGYRVEPGAGFVVEIRSVS